MPDRPPRIYVIGPFRASTELERRANIARAERTALEVAQAGAFYRCPHLHSAHFEGQAPGDGYWLAMGLDLLSECDAAVLVPGGPGGYLLPGHPGTSRGSIAEEKWCEEHGLLVLLDRYQVEEFVKKWTAKKSIGSCPHGSPTCRLATNRVCDDLCPGCRAEERRAGTRHPGAQEDAR